MLAPLSLTGAAAFGARESDTAYVLAHFFGYLGRAGDYRSISRAFLESGQYKGRAAGP